MNIKHRLSASVDAELVEVGQAAVEAGEADSLSGWANEVLRRQADQRARRRRVPRGRARRQRRRDPLELVGV